MLKLLLGIALLQVGCNSEEDDTAPPGGALFPEEMEPSGTPFQVVLSSAPQLPACAATGFFATGAATVILSEDESMVLVGGLQFGELSSAVTGAHIHWGSPSVAGPIIFDMNGASMRTFTSGSYPSSSGVPDDYGAFVDEMLAGNTYLDIHTESCPDGEIRGQLR